MDRRTLLLASIPLSAAILEIINNGSDLIKKNSNKENFSPKTKEEDLVFFNTYSQTYHNPDCEWAEKCSKNCVLISRNKAIKRGGKPCKVCNG